MLKKRLARAGSGKAVGFRTLLAFRSGFRAVFMFGFAKSAAHNVSSSELSNLKRAAALYLGFSDERIDEALRAKALREIAYADDYEEAAEDHQG